MRLEEFISQEATSAISRVAQSDDWSFNALVELSALDPSRDFRYTDLRGLDLRFADLRGFDFTGADLRECLKNEETQIDETTTFTGADLDWLHENETPIVDKMFQIENEISPKKRQRLLVELCTQYRSERHTQRYLRNLVNNTDSVETLFDLLDFFEPKSPLEKVDVSTTIVKFALKTIKLRGSRSAIPHSTSNFARFIERIEESSNLFVGECFANYLENRVDRGRVSLNPTKYEVSEDFQALIGAFDYRGNPQSSF